MKTFSIHLLLAAAMMSIVVAQETAPPPAAAPSAPADPDLPQPFTGDAVQGVIASSPFTRAVSPSDSLVISGIAYIDSKPVITIFDKDSKASYIVGDKPNSKGWTLSEYKPVTNLKYAQAKVTINGEVVSLRYDADVMTPANMKKKKGSSDSSSSGSRPPDGDRFRRSSSGGPSDEDRKRYESMSEAAKDKFRNSMRENMDRLRTAGTDEERRQMVRGMFDKIEKEDKGGK